MLWQALCALGCQRIPAPLRWTSAWTRRAWCCSTAPTTCWPRLASSPRRSAPLLLKACLRAACLHVACADICQVCRLCCGTAALLKACLLECVHGGDASEASTSAPSTYAGKQSPAVLASCPAAWKRACLSNVPHAQKCQEWCPEQGGACCTAALANTAALCPQCAAEGLQKLCAHCLLDLRAFAVHLWHSADLVVLVLPSQLRLAGIAHLALQA